MSQFSLNTLLAQSNAPGRLEGAADRVTKAVTEPMNTASKTFVEVFDQIMVIVPNVLGMIAILVVGYLVAKLLAKLSTALCETIGLQRAAERSGLADSMKQVGILRSVPSIVGLILFWLLMCVALMAGFNVLELEGVSDAMQQVVNFIPKILVATMVVVIGLLVASFLRGVVATSADRVGVSYAEYLANGCYYLLAGITFLTAASHLGLGLELLNQLILIAFGGLALGFALSFGLGGRDVMAGILSGYYVRQRFAAGDSVKVGDMDGTIRDVGAVSTTIETEENGVMHRHSVPNTVVLREGIR